MPPLTVPSLAWRMMSAKFDSEAAGVPRSLLARQEAHFVHDRVAARRNAWAVEDAYAARLAELKDLSRDARED